ncbi:GC-rich sequence DNA-binding factor-like protein-domain-containing protein [Kalaharituber pfeilii]|nr:GC-rich sequence DNA-binding factor-like protein-domain-containing protein [Kalaharituber pfeilii]
MPRKKDYLDAYSTSSSEDDDELDPALADDNGTGEFHSHHRRKRRRTGQEARDDAALGVFGSDSEYEDEGYRRRGKSSRPLRAKGVGFVKQGEVEGEEGEDEEDEEDEEIDKEQESVKEDLGTFAGLRGKTAAEDQDEDEDEDAPRIGLGGAGGIGRTMASRGLGAAYPDDDVDQPNEEERPRLGFGGGRGSLFKGFMKASTGRAGSTGPSSGDSTPQAVASGAETPGTDHRGLGFNAPVPSAVAGPKGLGASNFESPLGPGFVSSFARKRLQEPVAFSSPREATAPVVARPSFTDSTQHPHGKRKGHGVGGAGAQMPSINSNSFAARMMAKMGYVPGQGLGSQGQGILTPIEVKVRPQGVGVGAIKEKTEQAKAEARRAAALRGEVLSESESEKERKARKAKKAKKETTASFTGPSKKKEKAKFKTADEIEKSAAGLKVPNVLKNIVDMTGPEAKVLVSVSGLFSSAAQQVQKSPEEEERLKLARMARRDLESFAAEWKGIQEKKAYIDMEELRLTKEVDEQTEQIQRLSSVLELVEKLSNVSLDDGDEGRTGAEEEEKAIINLVEKLETLQFQFKNEVEVYKLSEVAVAAIVPLFKQSMATWNPLIDPFHLTEPLRRLNPLLKIKNKDDISTRYHKRGRLDKPNKTATYYESLIYNLWLPRVRSIINNHWDVHDPAPVLNLLEAWEPLLPPFVTANILNQLIMPKLKAAITAWNPRIETSASSSKKKRTAVTAPPPHIWIFPWLPHVSTQTHLPGILTDIKQKFTALLSTHPLASGPIQGLPEWTELLGANVIETLLIRHLLPRLALLLRTDFSVNPADQDMLPLDTLWRWKDGFRVSTLAQLLKAEVFPKWLGTLHMWLTTKGVVLSEVSQWYQFWQEVVPEDVRASPMVTAEFEKGLDMINLAMDLGPGSERARRELPLPEAGPAKPIKTADEASRKQKAREKDKERERAKKIVVAEQVSFRDAVEDWCAENNLLLIPLRKADESSGQPLFRITASASGGGGVVVYFKGDVVWGQSKKNREKFEPMALDQVLERVGG